MTPRESETGPFEAFEANGWEQQAEGYEGFFRELTCGVIDPLLSAVDLRPGSHLLDVATGPGHLAGWAAGRGARAVGIDVAPAMVGLARKRWPAATFRQGDVHALPFPDTTFDAITCSFGLLHFGRPERAAAEMVRVLIPGGRIALTVWARPDEVALFEAVLAALDACNVSAPPGLPEGPAFFRFSDDGELRSLLAAQGLDELAIQSLGLTLRLRDGDHAWQGILEGTVRTSALIRGHPPALQRRLRQAFTDNLEQYRQGTHLELPIGVKLASARLGHDGEPGRRDPT
jgi:SAM-dependent methyltransferase